MHVPPNKGGLKELIPPGVYAEWQRDADKILFFFMAVVTEMRFPNAERFYRTSKVNTKICNFVLSYR